ncbi:unnamed protein product [Cyclocybe aegerita]|uniref:Uncharacterized protein n=1 Tax=Cyclocybe aegerita TaxID=1973307 RepID=A0A8S0WE51_CYCAE|nr:unnamed protein product [Cyclocybe aegerita]
MSSSSLAFFASAAASFHPTPYVPAATASSSSSRPVVSTRNSHRGHDSLAVPPGMDPLPTDPKVHFIHPPFTTFPNSNQHPDGLTYSLMAENPEWFLDPCDFVSQHNANPKAISYPPHLEPPRGWCPAKKKDLKERGGEGWPEGEEPRLRCTFCRRTYAGVNAKSMWRRHVFEKHKIAMSNRRDGGTDRPRGRGSGKENKLHISGRAREDAHDSLLSIIVAPQTAPENVSHKSRFRSSKPIEVPKTRDRERRRTQQPLPLTPYHFQQELIPPAKEESEIEAPLKAMTPPLTPHVSSDPPVVLGENSDGLVSPSPNISHPVIPESPYNPLQTPSFRHSPPRPPSDQPWRYPSPSHPLHSNTRDLSLTMLTRPTATPIVKGLPSFGTSPTSMLAMHSSPLSAIIYSDVGPFETPAGAKFLFAKPAPRSRLADQISSPLSASPIVGTSSSQDLRGSPLPRKRRRAAVEHKRNSSDVSEAWLSENCLAPSSLPVDTSNNDPFSIYDSWPSVGGESTISPVRLPRTRLDAESPVLRNGSSSVVGLGIGLLEPFRYPKDESLSSAVDAELTAILSSPGYGEAMSLDEGSPHPKKRKVSPEVYR